MSETIVPHRINIYQNRKPMLSDVTIRVKIDEFTSLIGFNPRHPKLLWWLL